MADQPILTSLSVPTQDERTMAFLAHLLQIFTGFISPLVIYLVKRDSQFVKFHALQALVWQICYMVFFIAGLIFFFVSVFTAAFHAATHPHSANDPPPVFVFSFLPFWLFWMVALAISVSNVILAIVYSIKANRGEWALYPIIGKWCLSKLAQSGFSSSQPLTK